MKKIIAIMLVSLPLMASASIDRNLTYLNEGSDVYELQGLLAEIGCLNVAPTGYFGPLTFAAVKCWQGMNGIQTTGYFGPISRAKYAILTAVQATSTEEAPSDVGTTTPVTPSNPPAYQPVYQSLQTVNEQTQPNNNVNIGSIIFREGDCGDENGGWKCRSFTTFTNQTSEDLTIEEFNAEITSDDFTAEELANIKVGLRGGPLTWKKGEMLLQVGAEFKNLPISNRDGVIYFKIISPKIDKDVNLVGLPLKFKLLDIKTFDKGDGTTGVGWTQVPLRD